ncbi:MAG TPA: ABC transporter permease, partial [Nitrosopumilaceae archaeon]|nr:ABC transporter permease [Nitrosopumilaceae archaeon]
MNLALYIAKRYIVSKKSNNAINVISWISVSAIAVGTCALVIVLSGMNGLTGLVENLYNAFDADIEITSSKGKVFIPDSTLIKKIKSIDGVIYINPTIEDNALLKYDDKQTLATIKGVSTDFFKMSRFDTLIFEGKYFTKEKNNYFTILGKGVAYRLGVNLNNAFVPVSMYSPKRGKSSSINPEDAFIESKVYPSGLFTINDEFDFKYAIIDVEAARNLFGYFNEVST